MKENTLTRIAAMFVAGCALIGPANAASDGDCWKTHSCTAEQRKAVACVKRALAALAYGHAASTSA